MLFLRRFPQQVSQPTPRSVQSDSQAVRGPCRVWFRASADAPREAAVVLAPSPGSGRGELKPETPNPPPCHSARQQS